MEDFEIKDYINLATIAAFAIGLALGFLLSPVKKGINIKTTILSNNKGNGSKNGSENGKGISKN